MKRLFSILSTLATAHAFGRIIISNQCDSEIYLRSIFETPGSEASAISSSSSYAETYLPASTLYLAATPYFSINGTSPADPGRTVFSYHLSSLSSSNDTIFWTMKNYLNAPFAGRTVTVKPSDAGCEGVIWGSGKPSGSGDEERRCGSEVDLVMSVCTGGCLPSWSPCGRNAKPGDEWRVCCTHCIGDHHCVEG